MDQNSKWGMEMKSPFSKAGMDVDEARKSKTFCLEKIPDGTIKLKRNHDYYVKVQGQPYCSNLDLKGIIFVVYFGEDKPLFIENIFFDASCWDEYLPKIADYYFKRSFFSRNVDHEGSTWKLLYIHGGWIPCGNYSGLHIKWS